MLTNKYLWAFLYLLTVPAFAWIYYLNPYGFYHGTAVYEQSYYRLQHEAATAIWEAVVTTNRNARHGASSIKTPDGTVELAGLVLNDPETTVDGALLDGYVQFADDTGRVTRRKFSFAVDSQEKVLRDGVYLHAARLLDADLNVKAYQLFPGYGERTDSQGDAVLQLTPDQHRVLINFLDTARGFPHATKGHYYRMLYLSAVTLTTLGYGDVVPVTDHMRLLVACEAMLGMVFIGLFLNALSSEKL